MKMLNKKANDGVKKNNSTNAGAIVDNNYNNFEKVKK